MVEDLVFDASAIVLQTTQRWQAPAAAAGKTLQAPAAAPAPDDCAVRGSPTRLGEVVSNLIDNALRYGGPHVTVGVSARGRRIRIRVCDDGPALDASTRTQMLLPFWRGEHGQPEGSGLGLSIALRVVERMGGHLAVHLGPDGTGTCLDIDLPRAAAR